MDKSEFLSAENWRGGDYELGIEYLPGGNENRLNKALRSIWHMSNLSGPWTRPEDYLRPTAPPIITRASYGLLELPNHTTVQCITSVVQGVENDESDWLIFGIPMGTLERIFPVNYSPR